MRHPRQVLTRSQIFEAVWGYDFGPRSNSLEVYVGYLRRKTEEGGEPRLIQTVRGVGLRRSRRRREVSLRRRLALLSALAVALTVLLASVLVYALVRDRLRDQVDDDLRGQAERVSSSASRRGPGSRRAPGIAVAPAGPKARHGAARSEAIRRSTLPPARAGRSARRSASSSAPTATSSRRPARRSRSRSRARRASWPRAAGEPSFEDVEVGRHRLRVLTQPLAGRRRAPGRRARSRTPRTPSPRWS